MPHELISTKDLHFQDGYNIIRTAAEFKANSADVEKQMENLGDTPEAFPVLYVEIDGKKYTRNHSTLQAALNRGWKKVYAMPSPHAPGSAADYLDLVLSNNRAHPVSRAKQGEVYKMLRDGEGPGEAEIAACKLGEEPANKREPMTLDEISKACSPVYSAQHIGHCITLAESSPEIQELMETRNVAANVVIKAAQWSKGKKSDEVDEKKQLRIIKAAIKQADADGEGGAKKVTEKHLNAVKSEFVKLKAAGGDEGDSKETKDKSVKASSSPAKGSGDDDKDDTAELPGGETVTNDEPVTELFPQANEILTEGSKKNEKLKKALVTRFLDTEAMEKLGITLVLSDEEAELLASDVVGIVANAAEVF